MHLGSAEINATTIGLEILLKPIRRLSDAWKKLGGVIGFEPPASTSRVMRI